MNCLPFKYRLFIHGKSFQLIMELIGLMNELFTVGAILRLLARNIVPFERTLDDIWISDQHVKIIRKISLPICGLYCNRDSKCVFFSFGDKFICSLYSSGSNSTDLIFETNEDKHYFGIGKGRLLSWNCSNFFHVSKNSANMLKIPRLIQG